MHINSGNLTDLEKLLVKLKPFIMEEYHPYAKVITPCIIKGTKDDGKYEGVDLILVGDDTEIRQKDGKFYIFNMHYENDEPYLMNEQEVLDFYAGKNRAYDFPLIEDFSYQFIRGFVGVAKNLISSLESKLEII